MFSFFLTLACLFAMSLKRENEEKNTNSNTSTTIKLLLMGDSGTGKSSILLRFCEDIFRGEELATIGVDFQIKKFENFDGKGQDVKLTIWDTAGQERFRSLTTSYYRGTQGVILVYDVTRRESFNNLKSTWLKELAVYTDLDDLIIMIVGNKVDLEQESRQVSTEEGKEFAHQTSALFMESSAKTRLGINAIFNELVRKILINQKEHDYKKSGKSTTQNLVSIETKDNQDDFGGSVESGLCNC